MKARVNLKSDPISLTVLAASGIDHMAMEKVGHEGIMDIGVESVGETAFEKELTHLINRHSIEYVVDMPDFLLAGMICRMIAAMGPSIKKTLDWHGCDSGCHPSPNSVIDMTSEKV